MIETVQIIVTSIATYFIIRLFRTTGQYAPNFKDHRLEYAHRILLELEATDKIMNILPLELKHELQSYMKESRA